MVDGETGMASRYEDFFLQGHNVRGVAFLKCDGCIKVYILACSYRIDDLTSSVVIVRFERERR